MFEKLIAYLETDPNVASIKENDKTIYIVLKDISIVNIDSLKENFHISDIRVHGNKLIIKKNIMEVTMEKKFDDLSKKIINLIGGTNNISRVSHCITRLRFDVKDKNLVSIEEIKKIKNVVDVIWSGMQLQIIIGPEVVEAYDEIVKNNNLNDLVNDQCNDDEKNKKKFNFNNIINAISSCITPILPMMAAGGMLKALLSLLIFFKIITDTSPTYITLNFIADAAFYFFPIAIGVTGAKRFKVDTSIGIMLGGVLIHPTFVSLVQEGVDISIFSIPIYAKTYSTTIIPMILTMWICGYVYRFFKKYIPNSISILFVPLLTVLVVAPLMLCAIAPIGGILGDYLVNIISATYDSIGPIAIAFLSCLYPLIVMTGMHSSLGVIATTQYAATGMDPIMGISMLVSNTNQGIAALAVALKSKDSKTKQLATSTGIPAILAGVTEPVFYGLNLKLKTPLIGAMVGSFVGGLLGGLLHVVRFAPMGGAYTLGIAVYLGEPMSNFTNMLISLIVGVVVTFITTYIIYKPEGEKQ